MVRAQIYFFKYNENNITFQRYIDVAMDFLRIPNRGLGQFSYSTEEERIFYTTVDYNGYHKNLIEINLQNGTSTIITPAQPFWVQSEMQYHQRFKTWYSLFINKLTQLDNGRFQEITVKKFFYKDR
jgi:hypothetical protein